MQLPLDGATYDADEGGPHLLGPDAVTGAAEAVDHDFGRQRGVEVRRENGGHVVVGQRVRDVEVVLRVQVEARVDLFGSGRQQVEVVERTLVPEAAHRLVAHHLLVPFISSPVPIHYIINHHKSYHDLAVSVQNYSSGPITRENPSGQRDKQTEKID